MQSSAPASAKAWLMTITAGLLFFYEFIQLSAMNTLSPILKQQFHFSHQQLGLISSAYFIANASLVFVAGNILDRYSARRATIFSTILCTLGTLYFAYASSFWQFYLARFIIGIGGAFCFLSGLKIASRWFPINKLGRATGVLVTMAMLGGMLAQSPLQSLINYLNWHAALLIDVMLGGIILLAMYFILEDAPMHKVMRRADIQVMQTLIPSIKLALQNYKNYLVAIYTCCLNFPVFILGAIWGISYLHQGLNYSTIAAAHICGMLFLGSIIGAPIVGILIDKFGMHRKFMQLGAILCVLLFGIVISQIIHNTIFMSIIFFMLGLISSSQIISYAYISMHNCRSITSAATSIISTTLLLGAAFMQPLFGKILDYIKPLYGIHSAYNDAILLLPASIAVALIAAYFLPKQHHTGDTH